IAGSECVEFFGDSDVAFVRGDGEAKMEVLLELIADRGKHAGRAVANIEAADAASEIEIAIGGDVFDNGAVGVGGENRGGVRRAARNGGFAARHKCARLWTGYFGANLNGRHFLFSSL